MDILAKPKGTTLEEHTQNVVSESKKIIAHHSFAVRNYSKITGHDLAKRLNGAATFHDSGKAQIIWQTACRKDFEILKATGKVGDNLKITGVRHEIESLKIHKEDGFSNPVKVAIAAHHAKLSWRFRDRWVKLKNGATDIEGLRLWNEFEGLASNVSLEKTLKEIVLHNYEFSAVRAYLQLADHRASILEDNSSVPVFKKFEYTFNPKWTPRKVQILVEEHWKDDLMLLRAPTGAGKTDASLLWAKKQIDNDRADRLVIAMPTRFTSNALSININDSFSDTGLYHSSAWFAKFFEKSKKSFDFERFAKLEHEFARLLETPVTVCTIDHLLISQTHTREDHHSITFNLANSCVVIDEADFYDEFTQANILQLLKILKTFDVPVLLMSASLPESALKLYQQTGYNVTTIREDSSEYGRPRCNVTSITKYNSVDEISEILEKAILQPTIIYANTVARAMDFYRWCEKRNVPDVVLYHSRFTEPDKLLKENLLIENLGHSAWESGNAKGIAILTQIGEMSVNISARLMISELCPMDRLVQRAGRLCRFDNVVGDLEILIPQKDENLYPAPYGTFQRGKGWTPNNAMIETEKKLKLGESNARTFVQFINDIYIDLPKFSDLAERNQKNYINHIKNNWLIVPMNETKEDDEQTSTWKSRNITGQTELFVIHPTEYIKLNPQAKNYDTGTFFNNYKEFQYYKNQFSVNYPNYLVAKGKEDGRVFSCDIWIGNEKDSKSIWVAQAIYYSKDLGLCIDIENDSQL